MKKWFLYSSMCLSSMLCVAAEDLIQSITVDKNMVVVRVNEEFKERYLTDDFFVKYDNDIDLSKLDYSIQSMPFVMNVISIVWVSGETYYVDSMDKELYASLKVVKKVLQRLYPKTSWKGKIIPRKLVENSFSPLEVYEDRIAMLFSGGVDSTASSLYHRDKKQLLITAWGHWDLPLTDKELWWSRKEDFKAFAREYGHENTFIRSNYSAFLNRPVLDKLSPEIHSWRIFAVEGIGWAGLVAPLLLLKGYPVLYHGSTISWDFPYPAAANPFIDDNLRFAGVGLKHDLFDINRLEKCQLIADIIKENGFSYPFVRVCEEKIAENCCHCQKCVRTILEFLVSGEDPRNYGFPINHETVMDEIREDLTCHPMLLSATAWHMGHIQDYLLAQKNQGLPIHPGFEWILELEIRNRKTFDIKDITHIRWTDFVDFLPNIKIPKCYRPKKTA